ncbi:Hypothetical predicted protein [Cloeon dipterum]|uniref:Uncharacterized protein n=1 Tax=Cloeon dipterum TaxID=197152 RepID=A0A8S1C3B3_9INSE|nr:Hypothetical predicted protein [Cloeon dipterum]
MDISAIEEYLRIYRVNTRRKHGFEEVDLWSDALEPDLSELSILWKNVGAISYLLTNSKIEDDTEFTLEEMLSVHSIVDNDELGNLPSLAALAWQTTKAENSHRVASNMRMTLMLLNENADPNYISRVSCRSRYTVPDAISLAISSLCVPMFRTLLSYWWPSPVYLLDSPTGRQVKNFKFLFPIISKFGWPHGTRICSTGPFGGVISCKCVVRRAP